MFLPLTWDLLTRDYDLVVVDEMQDMSKAQLLMAQAVCRGRIAGFGDRRQAIYGFRGADTGSMDRIKAELQAGELPLTITYRCSQAVTRRAQALVPAIEAAPSNPEGSVSEVTYTDMLMAAQPGDFILSRLNAPLVSATLRLLLMRKKAKMRGRQIGQGLIGLIRRLTRGNLSAITITVLEERLDTWERKTVTKLLAGNQRDLAEKVRDQAAMIRAFSEDAPSVQRVVTDIEQLFTDVEDSDLVLLSSIHKAKGLEASTVYVLQETLYRRGITDEESNCEYVSVTRAIEHLKIVTGVPGMEKR
jgi:ATP-dependent exoDNAse (exonuclease V) beta subunit